MEASQIVVEVAQVFKDGGLGVRLRQLVADVRKLNALGKGAGRHPAHAVLIHGPHREYWACAEWGLPSPLYFRMTA